MFIYNLKINGNILFKGILIFILIVAIVILGFSISKLYGASKFTVKDSIEANNIANIHSNQYTNILEEVYNNVDTYVGQKISFTGYIYRLYDMKENEFVLARDMLINSDSQSVVVGFLCTSDNAKNFKDGTWVNVSGSIVKGYYHNQIPVIEISEITETQKPEDAFVYPPDNNYIPTSVISGFNNKRNDCI